MDRLPAESASAVDPALQCSSQAAAARGSWHSWRTVVIALAILAVAIALLRLRTHYEADLAIYMYVGHAITSGPGSSTAHPSSRRETWVGRSRICSGPERRSPSTILGRPPR